MRPINKSNRSEIKPTLQTRLESPYFRLCMMAILLIMGLLYVVQMSFSATKGYEIRELEQKIAILEKEHRDLELEAMELQSLERIVEQLPEYQLVKAQPDDFVNTATATVASR